ncbi:YidB family protein [Variovorax sp. PAMC 28711]|uniref:YidB family protein n=1 Tax=Variovorax sp. PAMC 28711 TaxID=1795631 RepID=UPI00078B5661|nr:YidB family protein [Variovorax sp. PAMC 28711]AMM23629.1 hypothetical protein AX767_04185 [Variovorax sp. PAMC 28711]
MFDTLIKEVATRFGLGNEKSQSLVQLLLAYITSKDTGGLPGFVDKLMSAGLGERMQSWVGGASASPAGAQAVSTDQIQQVFGGPSGLLRMFSSRLGVDSQTGSSVLSFLLPAVIGKLTPQGNVPATIPLEISQFIGGTKDLFSRGASAGAAAVSGTVHAAAQAGRSTGSGFMRWLPWLLIAIAALLLLGYCSKMNPTANKAVEAVKQVGDAAGDAAKSGAAAVTDAAKTVVDAIPTGAGALAAMIDGVPSLKVYFDTGKTELSTEFPERAKTLVDYLKANGDTKAVISGFTDTTGDPVLNDALSKKRAEAVADALKSAGVAEANIVLEKPAAASTTGNTDAELRRVEVVLRK